MIHSTLCSDCPELPDMKQIVTQTQHAAAMEASKQTGSTETVLDPARPKEPCPLSKKSSTTRAVQQLG